MSRRPDWQIDPIILRRRVARWKDITLLRKLRAVGIEAYSPKYYRSIRLGTYQIPNRRRKELENLYLRNMRGTNIEPGWYTLGEWLNKMEKQHPALNLLFSLGMLRRNHFQHVYVSDKNRTVFSNVKTRGRPTQPAPIDPKTGLPKTVPQYLVYSITVEDTQEVEMWIQASKRLYYGPHPDGDEEVEEARRHLEEYERENQRDKERMDKSKLAYTFNKNAKESHYEFIGIGIRLNFILG